MQDLHHQSAPHPPGQPIITPLTTSMLICRTRRDSRGRYSRDDGRSEMMEHLEAALDSATEQDREDIRRFMRKLEQA